jgi:hypothetical protein
MNDFTKPVQNLPFFSFLFHDFPPNFPSLSPSTPKSSHRRPPRTSRHRSELRRSSGSGDQFRTSTVDHCLLPSPSPSPATRYCQAPSPTTHTQPPAVFEFRVPFFGCQILVFGFDVSLVCLYYGIMMFICKTDYLQEK